MIPEIFLAPMAGFTDAATRELSYEYGAQMAVTEMISAKGLLYHNTKTNDLLKLGENEDQIIVQLFGSEPEVIAAAAQNVSDKLKEKLYGIDINMGCPAPKIVKNGEGCALMLNIEKAKRIINAVRKAFDGILSVKFRKGFDQNNINAVELAKTAEDSGCDFLTIHGRTRDQYYAGKADWQIIKDVNNAVRIPVVANGDISSYNAVKRIKELTGCKSVMIGRAALGDPYIFKEIRLLNKCLPYKAPTNRQRIECCLKHAKAEMKYKNEKTAMLVMRTLAPKYIKGFNNSAKIREKLVHITAYRELQEIFEDYLLKYEIEQAYNSNKYKLLT